MTESLPGFLEPTLDPWRPDPARPRRVAVLMSGGVDSSVTAMMLLRDGWDAIGVTMIIPRVRSEDVRRSCCGWEVAGVCRDLGMPHYFLDTVQAFECHVIEPFRAAYADGRTPSPCVGCNSRMKFGLTLDAVAAAFGVKTVATGHYARIDQAAPGAPFYLRRAVDATRDQSYFLSGIRRERLGRILFPLGAMTKESVRAIARAEGIRVADRAASMDLCFAGETDYRLALDGASTRPGPIVDGSGRVLGRHQGIGGFTLGQRRGLGIAASEPLYVLRLDARTDTVTVGPREQGMHHEVAAKGVNVLSPESYHAGARLGARIRSSGEPRHCVLLAAETDRMTVRFGEPVFAPAPGQYLVLYDGDIVVAAGEIEG